jgi:hypothetical protein
MTPIPRPQPLSLAPFVAPANEPTYTQIFNETMGHFAGPDDGMGKAFADMGALSDALGAELAAEDTADNVGQALSLFAGVDTGNYDSTLTAYAATKDTGLGFLAGMEKASPPLLLELPMSIVFDGGIGAAPEQNTIDFGTVKLGSGPYAFFIGQGQVEPDGTLTGVLNVQFVGPGSDQWQLLDKNFTTHQGFVRDEYSIQFTPLFAGKFTLQINVTWAFPQKLQILTYTVNVIP